MTTAVQAAAAVQRAIPPLAVEIVDELAIAAALLCGRNKAGAEMLVAVMLPLPSVVKDPLSRLAPSTTLSLRTVIPSEFVTVVLPAIFVYSLFDTIYS
jgi:hypothetical protein